MIYKIYRIILSLSLNSTAKFGLNIVRGGSFFCCDAFGVLRLDLGKGEDGSEK